MTKPSKRPVHLKLIYLSVSLRIFIFFSRAMNQIGLSEAGLTQPNKQSGRSIRLKKFHHYLLNIHFILKKLIYYSIVTLISHKIMKFK